MRICTHFATTLSWRKAPEKPAADAPAKDQQDRTSRCKKPRRKHASGRILPHLAPSAFIAHKSFLVHVGTLNLRDRADPSCWLPSSQSCVEGLMAPSSAMNSVDPVRLQDLKNFPCKDLLAERIKEFKIVSSVEEPQTSCEEPQTSCTR